MSGDAREYVLKALRKHGYPLELRVGRALRKAGWFAQHAFWYRDPETGKTREFDVLAAVSALAKTGSSVHVNLVIECKQSSAVPWVAFTTPHRPPRPITVPNEIGRRILEVALDEGIPLPSEFSPRHEIAHGIAVADEKERKGGDPTSPSAAVQGTLTAAAAISSDMDEYCRAMARSGHSTAAIVLPVIVIGGELFRYFLDEDGNEQVDEIDSVSLVSASPQTTDLRLVNLVRESAFERWAAAAHDAIHDFCVAMLPHVNRVFREDEVRAS